MSSAILRTDVGIMTPLHDFNNKKKYLYNIILGMIYRILLSFEIFIENSTIILIGRRVSTR